MITLEQIHQQLARAIQESGLTQAELAKRLTKTIRDISQICLLANLYHFLKALYFHTAFCLPYKHPPAGVFCVFDGKERPKMQIFTLGKKKLRSNAILFKKKVV